MDQSDAASAEWLGRVLASFVQCQAVPSASSDLGVTNMLTQILKDTKHMSDTLDQLKKSAIAAQQSADAANARVASHLDALRSQVGELKTVADLLRAQIADLQATPADTAANEAALGEVLTIVQGITAHIEKIDQPPAPAADPVEPAPSEPTSPAEPVADTPTPVADEPASPAPEPTADPNSGG